MIKKDNNSVLAVWQPLGSSTYQITNKLAEHFKVKATHTGVLDPMAEGVIIILLGEERYKKSEYSNGTKGYEFDITFGISTDSYDGMGLIEKYDPKAAPTNSQIEEALSKIDKKNYVQTVPLYSAIKVDAKKFFLYPKLGLAKPELPTKKGIIYKLNLRNMNMIPLVELVTDIITKIKKIEQGEFRQEKIIEGWDNFLAQLSEITNLVTATFYVETTRGIYVRSLSQDIADIIGIPGFVSRLVRVKNGAFTRESAESMEELLSEV